MPARVLLLSTTTGYQLRSFDEAAVRAGVELRLATDRCHHLDDPWRDRAIAVRFHDIEASVDAVAREARRASIDGVLAVGDRPTVLAARIAERLGLPGNPPDAAAASGNKHETRRRFHAHGLQTPWTVTVPASLGAPNVARDPRLRFPCVLKPLGLSGSRGVIRANDTGEFADAFARIQRLLRRVDVRAARAALEHDILVEGFIPGREFAVEGVLSHGVLQIYAVFDKPDPLDGPFFEETIYVTPSRLDPEAQRAIADAVSRGTQALGLRHGPVHAECRLGEAGLFVLEIAARPIGGLCAKAVRFADGRTLEDVLVRHAAGEDVSRVDADSGGSAVMMIPIPRRGVFKRVHGVDEALAVHGVDDVRITAKVDQLLEQLPEAGSYLGFVFATGADAAEAESSVREAHRRLVFDIDPAIPIVTSGAG